MVKKILICGMCLMVLLGTCVFAQNEMPQGGPPSGMQRPQGAPPEGMEFPEGMERPQDMPEDMQGFPGGGQWQRPQRNTDNAQAETGQPSNETGETVNQPEGQNGESQQGQSSEPQQGQNGEQQQEQNAEAQVPNMDFGGSNMPGGFNFGGTQTQAEPMTFMGFVKEYQTPVISVVLLLLAFVFVKLYKRKNY